MKEQMLILPFLDYTVLDYTVLGCSQNNEFIYPNFFGQKLNVIENNSDSGVLQKYSGDLNRNGFNDFALILESKSNMVKKKVLCWVKIYEHY